MRGFVLEFSSDRNGCYWAAGNHRLDDGVVRPGALGQSGLNQSDLRRRLMRFVLTLTVAVITWTCPTTSRSQIFRWNDGSMIPGSEDIIPGPSVNLEKWRSDDHNLRYADFSGNDLTDASFTFSWLENARFNEATLRGTAFRATQLAGADFTDAEIAGAFFNSPGLTSEQFYSTASYKRKYLSGIHYSGDISGWDISGQDFTRSHLSASAAVGTDVSGANLQNAGVILVNFTQANLSNTNLHSANLNRSNLTSANLISANLENANLEQANLTGANFHSAILRNAKFNGATFANTDFTQAIVSGADLRATTDTGFTSNQLYATGSYADQNLVNISFAENDLRGWDFSSQNISGADFTASAFDETTKLTGATILDAKFKQSMASGLTTAHLSSTRSYKTKNMRGVDLSVNDLSGWDLSGQYLVNADFSRATLTDVDFTGAVVLGTEFRLTDITKEQLYATGSYADKNMQRIRLDRTDLSGINLMDQNLTDAYFGNAMLDGANFIRADLTNAQFWGDVVDINLSSANLTDATLFRFADKSAIYNQWTLFPARFDPIASGLTLVESAAGDVDADGDLDVSDINDLSARIRDGFPSRELWLLGVFDANADSDVTQEDLRYWVKELKGTWFGDANLDGAFDSKDLIQVFEQNTYEDSIHNNSGWGEGDWNGDGEFDSSDLVIAFADNGYEIGQVAAFNAVPEPSAFALAVVGLWTACLRTRAQRTRAQRSRAQRSRAR